MRLMPRLRRSGRPAWAFAACAVLAAVACGETGDAAHPRSGAAGAERAAWNEAGRIGSADDSDPEFALVGDIALGAGQLFVLDPLARHVRVYAADGGSLLRSVGRPGHAPGEFVEPTDLVTDASGRLFALDRRNARIEVFDGTAGKRLAGLPLDFSATDLCVLGNRLFVLGLRDGLLIHEMSAESGAVLRSFAPDPVAGDPIGSLDRGGGFLACGPGDEIVYLPALRPEVHRYAASTGALLQTARIPRYRRVRVERHESGGVLFRAPSDGPNDQAAGLVRLADGDHLLQIGPVRPGASSEHEFLSIRSFILSPAGREVRPFSTTLPRIMAVRGDTAYAAATDPAPHILILTLNGA